MGRCLYNYSRERCGNYVNGPLSAMSVHLNMQLCGVTPVSKLYNAFGPYFGKLYVKSGKYKEFCPVESSRDLYSNAFIHFNRDVYRVMVVDIDHHVENKVFSISYYLERDLPIPNCITSTNRGVQLFFFLERGIPRRAKGNERSVRFFRDVLQKLSIAFGGDIHMNKSGTARNPFSVFNPTRFLHDNSYSLDELNLPHIRLKNVTASMVKRNTNVSGFARFDYGRFVPGERNSYMFRHLLFYKSINYYSHKKGLWLFSENDIFHRLLDYAHELNASTTCPLPYSEIRQICRSVSRPHYIWRSALKNYGILADYIAKQGISKIRKKQQAGAYYTNQLRRQRTAKKIITAYKRIISHAFPSVKALSMSTGLHRSTIWRHRDLLAKLLFWAFGRLHSIFGRLQYVSTRIISFILKLLDVYITKYITGEQKILGQISPPDKREAYGV